MAMIYDEDNDPYVKIWNEIDRRCSDLIPEDLLEGYREAVDYAEPEGAIAIAMADCAGMKIPLPPDILDLVEGRFRNSPSTINAIKKLRELC